MNNWTGIDLERAYADIGDFNEKSYEAEVKMREMYDHLFDTLRIYWASPNAVAFTSRSIPKALDLYQSYMIQRDQIISNAVSSAQALANANGAVFDSSRIDVVHDPISYENYSGCKDVNSSGVTGMVIEEVENAKSLLLNESGIVEDLLRALPTNISFYDASGSLMSTYKTNINSFSNRISEFNDDLVYGSNGISANIEAEVSSVEQGKQEAQQLLENISTQPNEPNEPNEPVNPSAPLNPPFD